ncbi:rsph10b, partial [Symbiodinium necroappetens]
MGTSKKKAVVTPKKPKKKREKKRETESPSEEHRIVTVTLNEHTYTGYVKTNSIGKRCFDAVSAKYQWKNGTQYEGPFVQSDIQGHGKYTWPDGSSYQGNLLNGRRHGHGVFLAADGVTKYEGQWENGKRHGKGRLVYDRAGESFYEGEWQDGCKHGHGRQVWPSKNTYEGHWDQGRIHGFGTMTWSENGMLECYTGEWANDMPEGQGKYTWHVRDDGREGQGPRKEMPSQQSNNSFEGLWQKGLRSGYGTFNFASGAQYKGQWSENIKHGEGRYTYEDGRVYTGEFVMDNMAKDSTASEIPAEASTQFLNVGGAENPVRRCVEINDLTGFCLPNDRTITDPTELTGYTDPTEVFREIYNILLRQVGDLKKVYAKVRRIIQRPGDDPWVMYAFQLWMLLRDTGMLTPECPLSRVNRYIMSGMRRHGEAFHEDLQELRPLTPRPSVMSSRDAKQGKASKENSGEATEATDEDDDYDDEEEGEAEDSFMHDEENEDDGDDRNSARTRQSRVSRANSRVSRVSRGTNRTMGEGAAQPGRRPTIQSLGTRQFGSSGPMDFFFDQSKFWRLGDAEASEKILDVHAPTTALMFRHFLEALVRMAPAAYPENQGLESMLKALLRERFLPKVEQPIGVESCGTFEFLADGQLQQVFANFQTKLWELFKDNTTGFGAYELPQWAHILDLDADEGSDCSSCMWNDTAEQVHIQGRMCVSIRVKDARSLAQTLVSVSELFTAPLRPRGLRLRSICRASPEDYWKVLGVPSGTSVKEVKRVYRRRAKEEHPDVNKSPGALKRWQRLSEAYGKLIDPEYRKKWSEEEARRSARTQESRRTYTSNPGTSTKRADDIREPPAPGFPKTRDAKKWAAAGWDAFQDILRRAESLRQPRGYRDASAFRELRASQEDLAKAQQKLKQLSSDEEYYLNLTDSYRRSGQKREELRAGLRTLEIREELKKLRARINSLSEQADYWRSVSDVLHILNYANLLCIGSIQSCIDNPTGSVFTVQQEEPTLAEPVERPITSSSPGTTPIEELGSLRGAMGDMPSQTPADSAPPINMDALDPRSQTPAGESTATGE